MIRFIGLCICKFSELLALLTSLLCLAGICTGDTELLRGVIIIGFSALVFVLGELGRMEMEE